MAWQLSKMYYFRAALTSQCSGGYITKAPSPQDKRAYYILPTDKAWELVEWAKADLNEKLENLVDELGPVGFQALVELAEKANAIMKTSR